jgi:hypothetical protein
MLTGKPPYGYFKKDSDTTNEDYIRYLDKVMHGISNEYLSQIQTEFCISDEMIQLIKDMTNINRKYRLGYGKQSLLSDILNHKAFDPTLKQLAKDLIYNPDYKLPKSFKQ